MGGQAQAAVHDDQHERLRLGPSDFHLTVLAILLIRG